MSLVGQQVRELFQGLCRDRQTAGQAQGHHPVPRAQAAQAGRAPRSSRAQPLRGRHGEVHRVRTVRRGVPGPVHLRARGRQPPDAPVSPGERYGFVYEINFLRCIHCDLCVEACPTEAITESKLFEFSFTNLRRRHLHQGRAGGGRCRQAQGDALGRLEARGTTATPPPGCGPLRPRAGPTWRGWRCGREGSATACARLRWASPTLRRLTCPPILTSRSGRWAAAELKGCRREHGQAGKAAGHLSVPSPGARQMEPLAVTVGWPAPRPGPCTPWAR